ncbi:MAG: hypothetical protein LBU27_04095 [Candidatus Peribacteria bacterium]|nr:hypothetical protein [Candidatus Peribacteria bacterium]
MYDFLAGLDLNSDWTTLQDAIKNGISDAKKALEQAESLYSPEIAAKFAKFAPVLAFLETAANNARYQHLTAEQRTRIETHVKTLIETLQSQFGIVVPQGQQTVKDGLEALTKLIADLQQEIEKANGTIGNWQRLAGTNEKVATAILAFLTSNHELAQAVVNPATSYTVVKVAQPITPTTLTATGVIKGSSYTFTLASLPTGYFYTGANVNGDTITVSSLSATTTGAYRVYTIAKDDCEPIYSDYAQWTVTVDTEHPEMTVFAPLSGAYLQTKDVKVSITGTDNIALS